MDLLMEKLEQIERKKNLKYFIYYKKEEKFKLLCIKLPQMSGYLNSSEENKYFLFLIKGNQLLIKYYKI